MKVHKAERLAHRLKRQRKRLLEHYEDEELHQLRISLRRTRSLLKPEPGSRARKLRRDVGRLADATNDARDWDTFTDYCRMQLPGEQFQHLSSALEVKKQRAHHKVGLMLNSKQWFKTTRRWRRYSRRKHLGEATGSKPGRDLARARNRVAKTRRHALLSGDDRSWHDLRIAIKELRYTLDSLAQYADKREARDTLRACQLLQDELGDWHDTVVHRELLEQLVQKGATGDARGIDQAGVILRGLIEQRRLECLHRARSILETRAAHF